MKQQEKKTKTKTSLTKRNSKYYNLTVAANTFQFTIIV